MSPLRHTCTKLIGASSTNQIPLGKRRSKREREMDPKFRETTTTVNHKEVTKGSTQATYDYERWEVQQLVRSGVLSVEDNPDFDEEHGVLGFEETEAELDVELNDVQPTFIRSMMVKNPAL